MRGFTQIISLCEPILNYEVLGRSCQPERSKNPCSIHKLSDTLGSGLDLIGLGLDQVPPQLLEEILTSYPRLNFKSAFRDLLVEHCRRNPAAQILTWTEEVARTAGCTLHGQPLPTASQLMLAAPYAE